MLQDRLAKAETMLLLVFFPCLFLSWSSAMVQMRCLKSQLVSLEAGGMYCRCDFNMGEKERRQPKVKAYARLVEVSLA